MFRSSKKNPLEKENATPLYPEESSYKYGAKKVEGTTPEPYFPAEDKRIPPMHHFQGMTREEPETTLGVGVVFKGELTFERLLKIDGSFEGTLISKGKVIVGPKGVVKANLNLREAVIEGKIEGNITVDERLELKGEAIIQGDIIAKTLSVDEGVTINGLVSVNPV